VSTSRQEFVDSEYDAPREGLEAQVAEIVADVLGIDRVGRSDSFYDFGGTSLQAIRVCVRIDNALGIKVEPLTLFDNDVLADFVAEMNSQAGEVTGG
jgi:acyl carrier protein